MVDGLWTPCTDGKYSPHSGYMWLMGVQRTVSWAPVVWNRFNVQKHGFIMWLTCHKKLITRDRLQNWNMLITDDKCLLCASDSESIEHLYFHMPI